MDLNELQAGSTLYLPVFLKGGLIWTGDSHCRQGNGAETTTDWIFMGYDEDLNQAMKIAVEQTVHWLASQQIVPMSREEAYRARLDRGGLSRDAGRRYPQGRALHAAHKGS